MLEGVNGMQNGSQFPPEAEIQEQDCAFCRRDTIINVLKETSSFLIAADHAPLLEGHLLVIPKQHYSCYGAVPAELDGELAGVKREMEQFFARYYAPVVFWEHGVFRQTVFHAHLHCFPFGEIEYGPAENLHSRSVQSQDDVRAWFATRGHYFYLEHAQFAALFEPDMQRYLQIIQGVLWRGVATRTQQKVWRSPQQRYEEGVLLIEATKAKWHTFQQEQQGATCADETRETSAR